MPWLTWTTGSPTLSSDRSLISALTSLVCSWRRRRRAPGAIANSSVSVTNSIVRASSSPAPSDARRSPARAARRRSRSARRRPRTRPAWRRSADRCGCRAAARAGSRAGLRSRRRSGRGAASPRRGSAGACSGSGAPRSTLRSGRARRPRPRLLALAAQRQQRVRAAGGEELLGLQEQRLGRQDRPLAVVLEEAMALARVGPEALQRLVDLAVQRRASPSAPR